MLSHVIEGLKLWRVWHWSAQPQGDCSELLIWFIGGTREWILTDHNNILGTEGEGIIFKSPKLVKKTMDMAPSHLLDKVLSCPSHLSLKLTKKTKVPLYCTHSNAFSVISLLLQYSRYRCWYGDHYHVGQNCTRQKLMQEVKSCVHMKWKRLSNRIHKQ